MLRRIWSPCIPWKKPWQFYFACNSFDHQTLYKMVGARCSFHRYKKQGERIKQPLITDLLCLISHGVNFVFSWVSKAPKSKLSIWIAPAEKGRLYWWGRKVRQASLIKTKRQAGFIDGDQKVRQAWLSWLPWGCSASTQLKDENKKRFDRELFTL